jgi:hypothetical protein
VKFILVLIALFSINAFADGINGTWALPSMSVNGIQFNGSLAITDDSVTAANTCVFPDGVSVPASVTSKIQKSVKAIDANTSNNSSDANHTCQASITEGSLDYVVSGSTLTLTAATEPAAMVLTRVNGSAGSGLNGSWTAPAMNVNGIDMAMTIAFSDSTVTVSNKCTYVDGVSVTASATSKTASSFKILEAKTTTANPDGVHSCNSSIAVGTLGYSVNGNVLTLSMDGTPAPITLNRLK